MHGLKRLLAPQFCTYALAWALSHTDVKDAWALSSSFPVSLEPLELPHWPVFLVDMLPQGYGRKELLRRIGLPITQESAGDWPLLLAGAGNPIGHLRIKEAAEHFIVKFGRGPNEDLARILQHEAPYMELARLLGLRVNAPLKLLKSALFIPRFDRQVINGSVVRLAQESIAALTGKVGFDDVPSHNDVCRALAAVASHPLAEVLEYIKRDVANLALGNKDNHARNTAVQRRFDGHIALTPLYDFAPMYMHPDGIARRMRWTGNDGGNPNWDLVLDAVASECQLAHGQTLQTFDTGRPVGAAPPSH